MRPAPENRIAFDTKARWYLLVVLLAVCGLTVSVATRTFRLTVTHNTTVQSNEAKATRQHMDRDAVRWIPVVPVATILEPPTFYPRALPAKPRLPSVPIEENLYNRPPPTC
jgi:hypothetical protein